MLHLRSTTGSCQEPTRRCRTRAENEGTARGSLYWIHYCNIFGMVEGEYRWRCDEIAADGYTGFKLG